MKLLSGNLEMYFFLCLLTLGRIFYGWWRCWRPVTSQTMVAFLAAILDFTKDWKSG